MRTVSGGELAALLGAHPNHHVKVEVRDSADAWRDLAALEGENWLESFTVDCERIDQPVDNATINLRRDGPLGLSVAPLMTASAPNIIAAAYAPLLDLGARVRISVAVVANGATPAGGDFREIFSGRIDKVAWAQDPLVLECSSDAAWLMDTQIETIDSYGSPTGVALETVLQSLLTAWPSVLGSITLATPVSPGWNIREYAQERVKLLDAMRELALQIGWELRYRYNASHVLALTLFDVDRAATVPLQTFTPAQYEDVGAIDLTLDNIRNVVRVPYIDVDGDPQFEEAEGPPASLLQFGRRYMEVQEGASSNIDTAVEALAMAEAIVHDLAEPPLAHEKILPLWWPAQFGDLYAFTANGVHYDATQQGAVAGVRHDFREGEGKTTLQLRGSVSGAYREWLRREIRTRTADPYIAPLITPSTVGTTTDMTVGLEIVDPQSQVTLVEFRTRTNDGAFGAWAPVAGPSPYEQTVARVSTGRSGIGWRVTGYDARGDLAVLREGESSWPINRGVNPVVVRLSRSRFNAGTGKYEVWYRYYRQRGDDSLEEDPSLGFVTLAGPRNVIDGAGTAAANLVARHSPKESDGWRASWDSTSAQQWTFELVAYGVFEEVGFPGQEIDYQTTPFPDVTGTQSIVVPAAAPGSATPNALTFGAYLTGTPGSTFDGSAAVSVAVNAATTNTASTVVARDGSGNFAAGTITAALTGNASTATALATARTIWGQSFNGTGNVSGALTGATSGAFSTTLTVGGTATLSGRVNAYGPATTILNLRASDGVADTREWSFRIDGTTGAISLRSVLDNNTTVAPGFSIAHGTGVVTFTAAVGASITGTAATATALATSRTLWGQAFNGTANVSGALSGATTGTFSTSVSTPSLLSTGSLSLTAQSANSMVFNTNGELRLTIDSAGLANFTGALRTGGLVDVAYGVSTADAALQLGHARSASGFAYIDLVGDTTYTDYGLRLIRNDAGANASSMLRHRGTGALQLYADEAAAIECYTNALVRLTIASNGAIAADGTITAADFVLA
jgi:hypothetical protein